jgi:hypothetical protein
MKRTKAVAKDRDVLDDLFQASVPLPAALAPVEPAGTSVGESAISRVRLSFSYRRSGGKKLMVYSDFP